MKEKLAERIRYTRIQLGFSQQNMADELNLTVAAYSNIERGVTDINITRLYEIAEILKTTPIELLSDNNYLSDNNNVYLKGMSSQISFLSQQMNLLQQQFLALQSELNTIKSGK
jgi:transcriptional regulator with XRE-family HTH domain